MAKKTAPRKAPAKAEPPKPAPKPKADDPQKVTIRMYRQGLGDCFLLTFPGPESKKSAKVLIDCGVFLRSPGEGPRLRAVAEDILDATKGEIDLLIVTHEHWDHVSGFAHAAEAFAKFDFKAVWLSWAENPDDPDARAIKADLGKKKAQVEKGLTMALTRLGTGAEGSPPGDDLAISRAVLGFLGEDAVAGAGSPAAAPNPKKATAPKGAARLMDLGQAMDWVRAKTRPADFCSPGQRRDVPGTAGVAAYILGPPRDPAAIRREDPRGDQGYSDTTSLLGAVASALDEDDASGASGPFDGDYRIEEGEAAADPFFRRRYGFADDPLADPGTEWRRIDQDWLVGGLSRLALQLDVGVNNTSLALAFELPDGRTLIFPGDAQIGNWLSWLKVSFKVEDANGREKVVSATDLLNRAIFYKVGHHGSHNATMNVGGLEAMTGGDLVAMIPTDQVYASTKRPPITGWKMPAAGVAAALKRKTGGRVIRADHVSFDDVAAQVDEETRGRKSWSDFKSRVRFDGLFPEDAERGENSPLYVEFDIPL